MRATVVVFVAVAVAAMASAAVLQEQKVSRVKRGYGGVRLRSQEDRIARLADQVADLQDMADERLSGADRTLISALNARLDGAAGGTCKDNQFQCGGLTRQCVDSLEVCDGIEDCRNGHDEDEETCHIIAETGSSWKGGKVKDGCTNRQPYEMQVVFTDSKITDWFQARAKVYATVILRSKDRQSKSVASLPTSGYYNYANRVVYLNPPESDRLGLELEFDTGSNDSVNAYVVRESTGERCAKFLLFRD